jgi:hypothetical protein
MRLAALCLALLGQGSSEPASNSTTDTLGHRVRVVEMQGLAWRARLHPHLRPVARQGAATVWLLPENEASALDGEASHALYTPKPRTGREIPAESRTRLRVPYVAHLRRVADGPYGLATAVAFGPDVDYVEEGLDVDVRCQPEQGGARATVAIAETRLASIEKYDVQETVLPGPKARRGAVPTELKGQVQVPVLVEGKVEGTWSIPDGQQLVIGLGVHEMKRADGSRVLSERVAVIDPDDAPAPTTAATARRATRIISGPPAYDPSARRVAAPQAKQPAAPPPAAAPAPIAEAGRWTHAGPRAIALRAPTATPFAASDPMPPGAPQPIVIQTPGQGPTIIILPGSGPVNVITPSPESPALAMMPMGRAHLTPLPPPAGAILPAEPIAPMMPAPAMPALPSRDLPTPRNAAGEVVPLPPLPEGEAHVPVNEAGEPVPTPQTHRCPASAPSSEDPSESDDGGDRLAAEGSTAFVSRPDGHFSLSLAAGNSVSCDADSPTPRYVLGVRSDDGWRAAPGVRRDGDVERVAMTPRHGRLALSLQATSPVPTATVDGETTRVSLPLGPFRLHVEMRSDGAGETR